jgi:AcrR family transcriptional regulator
MADLERPVSPLPQRTDSKAIVEAILQAARELMLEGGEVTNHAISHRAGVGRASLHRYFPSRGALFAQLLRREHVRLGAGLREALFSTWTLEGGLRTCVEHYVPETSAEAGFRRRLNTVIPLAWSLDEYHEEAEAVRTLGVRWLQRFHSEVEESVLRRRVYYGMAIFRGINTMIVLDAALPFDREQLISDVTGLLIAVANGQVKGAGTSL